VENLSNSDDARAMQQGLDAGGGTIDIHHAGTAMRFLTAYYAAAEGREAILTGSDRMKQRPIGILVDALRALGAEIEYLENPGFPPLQIRGRRLQEKKVTLPADVSSQYISALLLVAPSLPQGLDLRLEGTVTSLPYIRMTLGLLGRLGVASEMEGNRIRVFPRETLSEQGCTVESDWSSASYYYSILALSNPGSRVSLGSYRPDSLQGDSVLQHLFPKLGVESTFEGDRLVLRRTEAPPIDHLELDLMEAPDLAQTLAVCCFGLGISCDLTGLHTLKIKETDRLLALQAELSKLGADVQVTGESLHLQAGGAFREGQVVATYNDHRMAMAFAPLALKTGLSIEDAGVVSKSYPGFWEDLEKLGFKVREA
jgi:3-phosphoshikimate 1-carboxyvinyltransferase